MPAAPLLSPPEEVEGVVLPITAGNVLTKSAIFVVPDALISSLPRMLTGVGAS
jgi:hypothetical protein